MTGILPVAAGGALGASGRYLIGLLPIRGVFPILTLLINFLGAVAIGAITAGAARRGMGDGWLLFWKTGVCGGFTTFSTFSLETIGLAESGHPALAVLYALLSVGLCVCGVALGQSLALRVL